MLAGDLEARLQPSAGGEGAAGSDDTADRERARLVKDLEEAETRLAAARARLTNDAFLAKAPPAVVEGARASEAELADQVDRLRQRLGV